MTPQDNNWPAWITAIGTGITLVGGAIGMALRSIFVTRKELRETVKELVGVQDKRHDENVKRFSNQDTMLADIRESVARIEGQVSGRYPRLER